MADAAAALGRTRGGERGAYSLYFAGQNIAYILIQGYLLMYYVSYLGLNPALVATIFLIVRIWDAVNDPAIGLVMDRVRFGANRFKGWINLSAFLMPAATFALFLMPPEASTALKVGYLVVSYLLWDVLFTISEVPAFAVSTSMSENENERTILLTLTQIGSVLGTAAGMGIIAIFLEDGVDQINWFLLAGVPAAIAMAVMIPQMFLIRERYHTEPDTTVSLRAMLREVLRNDQHFIMMGLYVSQALLNAVTVFAVYVAEGVYGDPQFANITALFSLLGVVVLGVFTPRIVRRYGKRRYLEVSMLVTILFSIPVFFIPGDNAILAMVFLGLRTMTLVVTSLLRPMFTADCVEYGQNKTGVRSESVAFAVQTLANKVGDALGVSIGGYILAIAAFDEGIPLAEQSAATMTQLQLWYIGLPVLMAVIMYLGPKLFYRLNEERVKEMIAENEAREAAAAAPADGDGG